MKSKVYKFVLILLSFLTVGLFAGCNSIQLNNCPYLITEQYISYDNANEYFSYAGAFFSIRNTSSKTISKITICFSLFDEEGNVLGMGNGQYKSTFEGEISAGKQKEIILSLDNILGNVNEAECKIDFAYVSEITYTDGIVWNDYLGLYSL